MNELTTKTNWDAHHARAPVAPPTGRAARAGERLLALLRGRKRTGSIHTYSDYILWTRLYERRLPRGGAVKSIEIGSAPGQHLLTLHERLGHDVYGVEYSELGVETNRRLFVAHGLDPTHVIHADFFDPEFQAKHRAGFDVVLSRGFIEHFADPREAVARHVALLKTGGVLVVSIPNLTGVNRWLVRFFAPASLARHNLSIMQPARFRTLFDDAGLECLNCGYYGIFDTDILLCERGPFVERLRQACKAVQLFLNILFRLFFRRGGPNLPSISPYLIYIGRRPDGRSDSAGGPRR